MSEPESVYERMRRMYAQHPSEEALLIYDRLKAASMVGEEEFLKVLKELEDEE